MIKASKQIIFVRKDHKDNLILISIAERRNLILMVLKMTKHLSHLH